MWRLFVVFFFWQCTALNPMSPMSGVTFSSCCNAQPPLLNERQQNVRRVKTLHMLLFKQPKKKKANIWIPLCQFKAASWSTVSVTYIHTVNIRCETFSICTVCEFDDYTFIFMCSAVIQIAIEHRSREGGKKQNKKKILTILSCQSILQKRWMCDCRSQPGEEITKQ